MAVLVLNLIAWFRNAWIMRPSVKVGRLGRRRPRRGYLCICLWLGAGILWACNPPSPVDPNETALHRAARDGHLDEVKQLLTQGAEVTAVNRWDQTPLHQAAGHGHLEVVKYLVTQGARLDAQDTTGQTPLFWAAAGSGDGALVANLASQGASVMMRDHIDDTILHHALYHSRSGQEQIEIVRIILDLGLPVDTPNGREESILHNVAQMGDACTGGKTALLLYLLERGATINARNQDGNTPLHLAASSLYAEGVSELIAQGADVEAQNLKGQTPLELARGADIGHFSHECRKALVKEQLILIEELLVSS